MAAIEDIENEIVEEFSIFDDPMDKYEYLIDVGKKLPPLDSKFMADDFLVKGCQSKVWLHAYEKEGKIYFEADSNTAITKGVIALLARVMSGHTANEISSSPLNFIEKINLRTLLSSQRGNGLSAMILRMKTYAQSFS